MTSVVHGTDAPAASTGATSKDSGSTLDPLPPGLRAMLEETLLPSRNSVDLGRGPQQDFLYRLVARQAHVAESFQENTKITPHSPVNIPLRRDLVEAIGRWNRDTAYRPAPDIIDEAEARRQRVQLPLGDLGKIGDLLTRLGADTRAEAAAYSLDFWVVEGAEIFRFVPGSPVLWLEKRLVGGDRREIGEALVEFPKAAFDSCDTVLFIAAVAWRYMLLQGPRGYRRCLMDAGAYLDQCGREAAELELMAAQSVDFIDARLDRLLALDGVERSVVAAVMLKDAERSLT